MDKIAIIGPAGAGKTTLALELESKLQLKVIHLDRIFWKRNWISKSGDTRIEIMDHLVMESQWIIEGSYINSSESRLNAADTIIFLDTSLLICLLRIIKRHHPLLCLLHHIKGDRNYHSNSPRDIPEGCIDKLTLYRILKLLFFPILDGRALNKKLRKYESTSLVRLQTTKDIENFLALLEPHTHEKHQS
jgi:hypothetical protein